MEKVARKDSRDSFGDRYGSPLEAELARRLWRNGIEVRRRGWPDFACFRNGELVAVVEVKKGSRRPKPDQMIILKAIAKAGIPAYYWNDADGLQKIGGPDATNLLPKT